MAFSFVAIFRTINFLYKRLPELYGKVERACSGIFRPAEFDTYEVVALKMHHIFYANFFVGFFHSGIRVGCIMIFVGRFAREVFVAPKIIFYCRN